MGMFIFSQPWTVYSLYGKYTISKSVKYDRHHYNTNSRTQAFIMLFSEYKHYQLMSCFFESVHLAHMPHRQIATAYIGATSGAAFASVGLNSLLVVSCIMFTYNRILLR